MNKKILGLSINNRPLSALVDDAIKAISSNRQIVFACANPHSLAVAEEDEKFKQALSNAEQLVCDGVGLSLLGFIFGSGKRPRITGSDFFYAVNERLASIDLGRQPRIFFFGSSERVLELIRKKMQEQYPEIKICGCLSPPFGEWSREENQGMVATINTVKPDVLWIGMTAPKQEKWVYDNREFLSANIVGSIGAVFDFYAETYPRAPKLLCKLGFEWTYRLAREPKRMWRRMVVSVPKFIYALIKYKLTNFGEKIG